MTKKNAVSDKLFFEKLYLERGCKYICGVDEVGRGPLAGPVAATAVIMDLSALVEGVDDSKKLTEKKRERLYDAILSAAVCSRTEFIDNVAIDEINILNATKRAMKLAIEGLSVRPDIVLIDAVPLNLSVKTHSIIKGDELSYSIGAASIIAKVSRDRLMRELDLKYPEYGFASNKGYGSERHIKAIKDYGATPVHRMSFLKNILVGRNICEYECKSLDLEKVAAADLK